MHGKLSVTQIKSAIEGKVRRHFGREIDEADNIEIFRACAHVLTDIMTENLLGTQQEVEETGKRQVHYLSLEFLLGRSLMKNAFNMGILDNMSKALEEIGVDAADLFETEPDAGLGNGGLGRLAACYIDSMTTMGLAATGYSICYEYGIFKQRIVEGEQVELRITGGRSTTYGCGRSWTRRRRSVSEAMSRSAGPGIRCLPSTKDIPRCLPCQWT